MQKQARSRISIIWPHFVNLFSFQKILKKVISLYLFTYFIFLVLFIPLFMFHLAKTLLNEMLPLKFYWQKVVLLFTQLANSSYLTF